MIKYRNRIARTINLILDSWIFIFSIIAALQIRKLTGKTPFIPVRLIFLDHSWLVALGVIIWNFLIYRYGLYPTNRLRKLEDIFYIIFKIVIVSGIISLLFIFWYRIYFVGRFVVVVFMLVAFVALLVKEVLVRNILLHRRKEGIGLRNVLIIGEGNYIAVMLRKIKHNPYLGLKISGLCYLDEDGNAESFLDVTDVGDDDVDLREFSKNRDLKLLLLNNNIDCVIIAVDKTRLADIEDIVLKAEEFGAEIWVLADFFELIFAKKEVDLLDDIPLLVFNTTPPPSWPLIAKRAIDIFGAVILLVITFPLFIMAYVGIKMTSPGPVIFAQKRLGLHGRKFVMYKFRSMVNDAEQRKKELADRNIMKGPVFKMESDPRVTAFGEFLRRTSIDELPQLWNVLKGEMTLVGPRPPLPQEVSEYRGWQRRRLSMPPGLTCIWQVSGRNKIVDFNEWAELDLKYIDNWSLFMDFGILLKTVYVVLFKLGAK